MSSRSLRVSADLFEQALKRGEVVSRSAAQQVEHWARLGRVVESSGLTVPQLVELLQGSVAEPKPLAATRGSRAARQAVPEAELWAYKRAQQQRDIASVAEGRATHDTMSWFSGGMAKRAKAGKGSPL